MVKPFELTHNEHRARAMLLGLWYDWRDGTYNNEDGRVTINALTLENDDFPIYSDRRKEWGFSYEGDDANMENPPPTPYCRE